MKLCLFLMSSKYYIFVRLYFKATFIVVYFSLISALRMLNTNEKNNSEQRSEYKIYGNYTQYLIIFLSY